MKRKAKPYTITWHQLYLAAVAFGIIGNEATKKDYYKMLQLIDKKLKHATRIRKGVYQIAFAD